MNTPTLPKGRAFECPVCGRHQCVVKDSRPHTLGGVRRRRECHHCKHRWTTYEVTYNEQMETIRLTGMAERFYALSNQNKDIVEAVMDAIMTEDEKRCVFRKPQND